MIGSSLLAAALVAAAPLGGPAPHPDSLSSSLVEVSGDAADVRLRLQMLSLLEVIEDLDADANGDVDADELEARVDSLRAYVASHYRLVVGTNDDLEGGTPLALETFGAIWLEPNGRSMLGRLEAGVECRMRFRARAPIDELVLEVTLFHDTSPDHVDLATVRWPDGADDSFGVMREAPRVRSDGTGRRAFPAFFRLGHRHILSGWDHLAFLALLLLGARSLWSLLGVITAFTVAHSITLAAAALRWIDVTAFSDYVEALIALSIAYVGTTNLLGRSDGRARWLEVFVFGLLHGLGFAGYLARSLIGEESKGWALLAFNLGIEVGQVLVVLGLAVLVWAIRRTRPVEGEPLVPDRVRIAGSVPLIALGLVWFFERV